MGSARQSRRGRTTAIPGEDWSPSPECKRRMESAYPGVNLGALLVEFRLWALATDARFVNWDRAFEQNVASKPWKREQFRIDGAAPAKRLTPEEIAFREQQERDQASRERQCQERYGVSYDEYVKHRHDDDWKAAHLRQVS